MSVQAFKSFTKCEYFAFELAIKRENIQSPTSIAILLRIAIDLVFFIPTKWLLIIPITCNIGEQILHLQYPLPLLHFIYTFTAVKKKKERKKKETFAMF